MCTVSYDQITYALQNDDTPFGSTINILDVIWQEEESTENSIKLYLKAPYFSLPVRLDMYILPEPCASFTSGRRQV